MADGSRQEAIICSEHNFVLDLEVAMRNGNCPVDALTYRAKGLQIQHQSHIKTE